MLDTIFIVIGIAIVAGLVGLAIWSLIYVISGRWAVDQRLDQVSKGW